MRPLLLTALLGLSWVALSRADPAKPQRPAASPILPQPVRALTLAKRYQSGPSSEAEQLSFSPDGKTLVTGGENCTLQFWDVASGRARQGLDRAFESVYALKFSPDGRWLAIGTSERVGVTMWDTRTGHLVRTFKKPYPLSKGHHIYQLAWTPDGKALLANNCEECQVWDVASGRLLREIAPQGRHCGLALSPDGTLLADGFAPKQSAGKQSAGKQSAGKQSAGKQSAGKQSAGKQSAGKQSAGSAKTREGVRVWDFKSGRVVRRVTRTKAWPLRFSPDGKQLLVRYQVDARMGQFDFRNGALVTHALTKITTYGGADPTTFSPDGRYLVAGHDDGSISVYEGRLRRPSYELRTLQTLHDGTTYILATAYSPDGKLLATSSRAGRVTLWRARP